MCNEYLDVLPLLGSGELSEAAEDRARAHLRTCPACRQMAARLDPVRALIGQPPADGWSANVVPAVRARLASRAAQHPATLGLRPAAPGVPFISPRTGRPGWATWATVGALGAALLIALLVGLAGLMQSHPQLGTTDAGTQTATASPAGTRTVVPIPAAGTFGPPLLGVHTAAPAAQIQFHWISDDAAGRPPAPGAFPTPAAPPLVARATWDQ